MRFGSLIRSSCGAFIVAVVVCGGIYLLGFLGLVPSALVPRVGVVPELIALAVAVAGAALLPWRPIGGRGGRLSRWLSLLALLVMAPIIAAILLRTADSDPPDESGVGFLILSAFFVLGVTSWTHFGFGSRAVAAGRNWPRTKAAIASVTIAALFFLFVPVAAAVRAERRGWDAEHTMYRELLFMTWYEPVVGNAVTFLYLAPLTPVWRAEAAHLAHRDLSSGRVRLLAGGRSGTFLVGIEEDTHFANSGDRGSDRFPWSCVISQDPGCTDAESGAPSNDAPGKPPRSFRFGKPLCRIVCTNEDKTARSFEAEVTPMGCFLTDDQAYYNRAMLESVLAAGVGRRAPEEATAPTSSRGPK